MSDKLVYLEMSWLEIQKAIEEQKLLIFCAGAVEQHGPHTPTGVDIFLPMEVALRTAKIVDAIVAPFTIYGYKSLLRTGGGPHFIGSVGLRGSTVIAMIKDIFLEFIHQGWRRILVIDWHVENCPFVYEGIDEAIRDAKEIGNLKVIKVENLLVSTLRLNPQIIDDVFGSDCLSLLTEHASIYETSLMLVTRPDLVNMDKAVNGRLPIPMDYDILPIPKNAAPESGVFCDATKSTLEKGDMLMNVLVQSLVNIVEKEFETSD